MRKNLIYAVGSAIIVVALSSTLSNLCGVGKRVLHAIPDLAWNFYAVSARPGLPQLDWQLGE
jgi:hypothetical protein